MMMEPIDDSLECPLCMEPLEMDDINFFPCTCGYQICRFCWHKIRHDENGLCPACRKVYAESPADYKPLSQEELQKIKQEKKQKEIQRKQKVTDGRKHLTNVRVVQKNLVFVVGLSTRLADTEVLKKTEYFGKFGKIHKVVINHTTNYAGSQGPSASAYVTYQRAEDALRAISHVNNIHVDGRILKASLGTTKYCSHFMKNQPCPKTDCMYLHELGDENASFTKEEMQQGKHQDFEKKLQDQYLGTGAGTKNNGSSDPPNNSNPTPVASSKRSHKDSISDSTNGVAAGQCNGVSSRNITPSISSTPTILPLDSIVLSPVEGWPSLLTGKDQVSSGGTSSFAPSSQTSQSLSVGGKKRGKNNATNSNSSPRQTPTRDHNSYNRRGRNEDSVSSANGTASVIRNSNSPDTDCSSDTNDINLDTQQQIPTEPTKTGKQNKRSKSRSPEDNVHNTSKQKEPKNKHCNGGTMNKLDDIEIYEGLDMVETNGPEAASVEDKEDHNEVEETVEVHHDLISEQIEAEEESNDESIPQAEEANGVPPMMNGEHHESPPPTAEDTHTIEAVRNGGVVDNSVPSPLVKDPSGWDMHKPYQQMNNGHSRPSEGMWGVAAKQPNSDHTPNVTARMDDDLGFDPFEETNKALAEEIIKEEKLKEAQQQRQQRIVAAAALQQQLQNEIESNNILGQNNSIKNLFNNSSMNSASRLPPPGFNGLANFSLNNFQNNALRHENNVSKLLPSVLSNMNSTLHGQQGMPPLNGMVQNRMTGNSSNLPPPGLSLLGSSNNGMGINRQTSSFNSLLESANSIGGRASLMGGAGNLDTSSLLHHLQQQNTSNAPPGLSSTLPKHDGGGASAFMLKDVENDLRNPYSLNSAVAGNNPNALNSFSNTLNGMSINNSLLGFNNINQQQQQNTSNFNNGVSQPQTINSLNQMGGNFNNLTAVSSQTSNNSNAISNLFNIAQQQQQQHQHQLSQALLQQLTMNSLHNQQKGWANNQSSSADLTALDPAIVASSVSGLNLGSFTNDSVRVSDSPPNWMQQLQQQQQRAESSNAWSAASLAPSMHHQQQQQQQQTNFMQQQVLMQQHQQNRSALGGGVGGGMWPVTPTSPPPGFSSPMHNMQQNQHHNIDNL